MPASGTGTSTADLFPMKFSVYLSLAVAGVGLAVSYALVERSFAAGSAATIVLAFACQQAYMTGRIALKLMF